MKPCPGCGGRDTLSVEWRLQARPLGSYSLAGHQPKVAATEVYILSCSTCGWSVEGHLEDGYFVADLAEDSK